MRVIHSCLLAISLSLAVTQVSAATKTIQIYGLNDKRSDHGIGAVIGTITFQDADDGLHIYTDIEGIAPGPHGFHIHQNPSCEGGETDGKWMPGLAAGDHFDPNKTHKHLGPKRKGHLGDLPVLVADSTGRAFHTLIAPRLTVEDLQKRSVIIHEGGDNYADHPSLLGGGGPRIGCGVIK